MSLCHTTTSTKRASMGCQSIHDAFHAHSKRSALINKPARPRSAFGSVNNSSSLLIYIASCSIRADRLYSLMSLSPIPPSSLLAHVRPQQMCQLRLTASRELVILFL
ncbi:hypothetical protein NW759_014959 [Fusarium solani]|nr:hypothetical protein NW759_014959 [Fusarium solani]